MSRTSVLNPWTAGKASLWLGSDGKASLWPTHEGSQTAEQSVQRTSTCSFCLMFPVQDRSPTGTASQDYLTCSRVLCTMNVLRVPVVTVVGGLHHGQHSPPGPSFSVHGPVLSPAFQTHAVQAMVDIHCLYTGRRGYPIYQALDQGFRITPRSVPSGA